MESVKEHYAKMAGGGSLRRWKSCKEMLQRWRAAGSPTHYREDQDGVRILDVQDRKEALSDRENPLRARLRKLRGELKYRLKLKKLEK